MVNILCGQESKSLFSDLFFSKENISEIQKNIRFTVFDRAKTIIGKQNETEMKVLMRSTYIDNPSTPETTTGYTSALAKLNKIVSSKASEYIIAEISQRNIYIRDALKNPSALMDLPEQPDTPRYNSLQLNKQ
jgi:hypothetical protein